MWYCVLILLLIFGCMWICKYTLARLLDTDITYLDFFVLCIFGIIILFIYCFNFNRSKDDHYEGW